eukprot:5620391-Pyramimonas_sp.AAC.1
MKTNPAIAEHTRTSISLAEGEPRGRPSKMTKSCAAAAATPISTARVSTEVVPVNCCAYTGACPRLQFEAYFAFYGRPTYTCDATVFSRTQQTVNTWIIVGSAAQRTSHTLL